MVDVALPAGLVSQTGSAPKFLTIDNSQWRRFGNWALIWLVLANAAFIGMWAVGAPPRVIDILAIGAVGLVVLKRAAREGGGVFPGACDRDVPALLVKDLKAAEKPQFVYWINSHRPVPPEMSLDADDRSPISNTLAAEYPMICRHFAPDRVPWMLLRWKGDAARQSTVAAGKTKAKDGTIG